MPRAQKDSLLELIAAIYDPDPSEREWLNALARIAHGPLGLDGLEGAMTFESRGDDYPILLEFDDATRERSEIIRAMIHGFPAQISSRAFDRPMVSTLSELFGAALIHEGPARALSPFSMVDPMGVVAVDTSGHGVVLTGAFREVTTLSADARRRWSRVTAHLASGLRLRRIAERPTDEAVLDLGGALHDATGAAETREHRVALRQAARAINRAKSTRTNADEAIDAWQALVAGRWSLIERFESDGRVYLVARPNPPRPRDFRPLSPRERAVVALAALGRANKFIAYELGVSLGTVASLLQRAQKKLGVRSRAGLVAAWARARSSVEASAPAI